MGLLTAARIDVGLQLSTWPETFSYTLSEYAMAGIPVVALPKGAVGERLTRDRLGWTAEDVSGVLATIETLAGAPAEITRCARAMDQASAARPIEPMRLEYEQRVARRRRRVGARRRSPPTRGERRGNTCWPSTPRAGRPRPVVEAELASLRQWMLSPRYRLADTLFRALERIPILWPAIVRLGDWLRGAR